MNENELRTICQECNKVYQHLGSHVAKAHHMTAREYKTKYGIDYRFSLMSLEVRRKKQLAFEADREKYLQNILEAGKKYQFKKGNSSLKRISEQSDERSRAIIDAVNLNAAGSCVVCHGHFEHIQSHLYNAHGLKIATK